MNNEFDTHDDHIDGLLGSAGSELRAARGRGDVHAAMAAAHEPAPAKKRPVMVPIAAATVLLAGAVGVGALVTQDRESAPVEFAAQPGLDPGAAPAPTAAPTTTVAGPPTTASPAGDYWQARTHAISNAGSTLMADCTMTDLGASTVTFTPMGDGQPVAPSAVNFSFHNVGIDHIGGSYHFFDEGPDLVVIDDTVAPGEDADAVLTERVITALTQLAPYMTCTAWSPKTVVNDTPIVVDESNSVTNAFGGYCFVPDTVGDPASVWGVPSGVGDALGGIGTVLTYSTQLYSAEPDAPVGQRRVEFQLLADVENPDRSIENATMVDMNAMVGQALGDPSFDGCGLH